MLARKPLSEPTVASNVLRWGTGAINVDGCRVGMSDADAAKIANMGGFGRASYVGAKGVALSGSVDGTLNKRDRDAQAHTAGRWPANLILSYPEDEYELRANVTSSQKQKLFKWLGENA